MSTLVHASRLTGFVSRLQTWYLQMQTRRHLGRLTEQQLRDIGLVRGDLLRPDLMQLRGP